MEFSNRKMLLTSFCLLLGPPNPENVPEDGKLKSECIVKDNRRYYLDLKENARGRFLRVSSASSSRSNENVDAFRSRYHKQSPVGVRGHKSPFQHRA